MQCAYLSIQIIFRLHFICYILTAKILYNHMYFVLPEGSHFSSRTSFWQVFNQSKSFSNTAINGRLLPCLAMSLHFLQDESFDAILYTWLIWLFQSSTNLECVCYVVLLVGWSIRSIVNLGFRPNQRKYGI